MVALLKYGGKEEIIVIDSKSTGELRRKHHLTEDKGEAG